MLINSARLFVVLVLLNSASSHAQESTAEIPASAFARLDSYVDAKISPNGERLAFLQPADGRWGIHVHTFAGGDTFRIPPAKDTNYNWLHWANDQTIVFSISHSSARQFTETIEAQLMAFSIDTDEIIPLIKPAPMRGNTDRRITRTTLQPPNVKVNANTRIARRLLPPPRVQDNIIDWMPEDPDYILVSLDEDHDAADEVRKIDLTSGDYEIVRTSREGIQHWVVDASGEVRFGYGNRNSEFQAQLKAADGAWSTLTETSWYDDGWLPRGFTSDPSRMYLTGPGQYGTREVRVLNVIEDTFEDTLYTDQKYDAAEIIKHPQTGRPAGVSYLTHKREYRYFDKDMNRIQRTVDKMFPDASNKITSMTRDKQKVLFETSSATDPGTLYVWDLASKSMESFGIKNPLISPDLMRPVEAVEYRSVGGTLIPAYLTLPATSEHTDLPTVVLPHGGPVARDDQSFSFLSQFLASRGYAVLQPNFRGSEGYGYDFENAGQGQWGGIMQDDVTAGAKWLVEQGIADKERLCIVGWSYGGYAATMGLVKTPELFRCGVSINGVYDLAEFIAEDKENADGSAWTRHMGLDGRNARAVSPLHQSQHIQAPLLIIHAEDDGQVEISQAKDMYRRLKKDGKPVKFVELPQCGHSMVDEAARLSVLESLESFLRANL